MVGSTPTRFRQLLDDSIAFVGVRTQETAYKVAFCSQVVPKLCWPFGVQVPQLSDVGSIPMARSISLNDSIALTRLSR